MYCIAIFFTLLSLFHLVDSSMTIAPFLSPFQIFMFAMNTTKVSTTILLIKSHFLSFNEVSRCFLLVALISISTCFLSWSSNFLLRNYIVICDVSIYSSNIRSWIKQGDIILQIPSSIGCRSRIMFRNSKYSWLDAYLKSTDKKTCVRVVQHKVKSMHTYNIANSKHFK